MPDLFGPSVTLQFKLSIPRAIPGAAGWYSLDPRRFLSNKAISVNERCHGTAPTVILMAGQQAGQSQGKRGKGRKLSISASLCPSGNPHSSGCKSPFPCPHVPEWMYGGLVCVGICLWVALSTSHHLSIHACSCGFVLFLFIFYKHCIQLFSNVLFALKASLLLGIRVWVCIQVLQL